MEINVWLNETTAAHVMVRNVVTVPAHALLAQAAAVLLHERISGVPVLDEQGACVGVLSVSDVVAAEEKVEAVRQQIAESDFWRSDLILPVTIYAERLAQVRDKVAPAGDQPVERFMTADLVSASESTPLGTIVQRMVDAHVHRVIILDGDRKLQGIVSTTDILAALLRAPQGG